MFDSILINVSTEKKHARSVGVYRIAHVLREHGWTCEVIDFVTYWQLDELIYFLQKRINKNTKFIGFSYLFVQNVELISKLQEWIKFQYPDVKIIVGSITKYPFNNKNVDYNISGFGENALMVLLKYLYSNGPAPKFSFNTNAGKHIDGNLHYPAYPLTSLMVKYEDRDYIESVEWLAIEFARGCKFSCAFCNFPVLGVRGDYSRDASDFEEQIRDAHDRFGVKNYLVSDETFNDRTEKITKFADVVEKFDFDVFFSGFIRADLLVSRPTDKEELLRMNFLGHLYGIESFNYETAKLVGKGMHPDKLKEGLTKIRNYFENTGSNKFRATISLIAGLPHEPVTSIHNTKDWLLENWQGQAFMIWPMDIQTSSFDKPSKISADYEKYGYRKINEDSYSNDHYYSTKLHSDSLRWENDYMNYIEADRLAAEVREIMFGNDFRLDSYVLGKTDLPPSLDDRLEILFSQYHDQESKKDTLQLNYKMKKLNQ